MSNIPIDLSKASSVVVLIFCTAWIIVDTDNIWNGIIFMVFGFLVVYVMEVLYAFMPKRK